MSFSCHLIITTVRNTVQDRQRGIASQVHGKQEVPVVVLEHWNRDDFLRHQVYIPCPSRNPLTFAFGWTRQTQIVRQEVAVEHVAVHMVLHLMVKHAIDDLVSDLFSTFERQVVPSTNNPKSHLAVNIASSR